jgi:hypothetical protein
MDLSVLPTELEFELRVLGILPPYPERDVAFEEVADEEPVRLPCVDEHGEYTF